MTSYDTNNNNNSKQKSNMFPDLIAYSFLAPLKLIKNTHNGFSKDLASTCRAQFEEAINDLIDIMAGKSVEVNREYYSERAEDYIFTIERKTIDIASIEQKTIAITSNNYKKNTMQNQQADLFIATFTHYRDYEIYIKLEAILLDKIKGNPTTLIKFYK